MISAVVFIAFCIQLVLTGMALWGYLGSHSHRESMPCRLLIIQITTIGNQNTVNKIIETIKGYDLGELAFQIWVVTEPGSTGYLGADRTVVVPAEFTCLASHKARALEYARQLRYDEGMGGADLKILFVDDDSTPSAAYIRTCAHRDADVCEGLVIPRTSYGRFLSHMDDLRTLNCLFFCSLFQGSGHPIEVHGEGLCVRASAENVVTWDYPIFASEDMVFGHMAAAKGLKWDFFHETVYITSPWTWRDHMRQRRRWLWGNIHAVRRVLPVWSKIRIVAKYTFGVGAFVIPTVGVILSFSGALDLPWGARVVTYLSFVTWLGAFAVSGWINSGGRWRSTAVAVILAYVTSLMVVVVLLVTLLQGNPRSFEVIGKERPESAL
jgi:hypothetical protein